MITPILEGYPDDASAPQVIQPELVEPPLPATATSTPDDHTEPLVDEPADASPIVQNALAQYRTAQQQLNHYSTAQKGLQDRVKLAEKRATQAREQVEQQIEQSTMRQHAHDHGYDYKAKSTLGNNGPWMP